MLTFETVLSAFHDYLAEDTRYEVIMASRGYVILEWNSNNRELESATFCPTPEDMKYTLLGAMAGYLQYQTTLCRRELTDQERQTIKEEVNRMDKSISLGGYL